MPIHKQRVAHYWHKPSLFDLLLPSSFSHQVQLKASRARKPWIKCQFISASQWKNLGEKWSSISWGEINFSLPRPDVFVAASTFGIFRGVGECHPKMASMGGKTKPQMATSWRGGKRNTSHLIPPGKKEILEGEWNHALTNASPVTYQSSYLPLENSFIWMREAKTSPLLQWPTHFLKSSVGAKEGTGGYHGTHGHHIGVPWSRPLHLKSTEKISVWALQQGEFMSILEKPLLWFLDAAFGRSIFTKSLLTQKLINLPFGF